MKMISDYTIYCTEAQTKKALELGAPIESEIEYQFLANQEHGYYSGDTFQGLVNCMGENTAIFGNEPNRIACLIPTAEQMIGWLRKEKGLFVEPYLNGECCYSFSPIVSTKEDGEIIHLEAEDDPDMATLVAIDAALEHLSTKNE